MDTIIIAETYKKYDKILQYPRAVYDSTANTLSKCKCKMTVQLKATVQMW